MWLLRRLYKDWKLPDGDGMRMLSQNSTAHIRRHGNDPVGFRQPLLSTGKYGPVDWEDPLDANRPILLLHGALFVCKYV